MIRLFHANASTAYLQECPAEVGHAAAALLSMPNAAGTGTESLVTQDPYLPKQFEFPAPLIGRIAKMLGEPHKFHAGERWAQLAHYLPDSQEWRDLLPDWGLRGDYQERAIAACLRQPQSILVSAAGSGKTIMAARWLECLLRQWTNPHRVCNVLWIAQTHEQVEQGREALCLTPSPRDDFWRIPDNLLERANIRVACWQSIDPQWDMSLSEVDVLIGDEIHSSSDAILAIADACVNAYWRLGMTATPVRTDRRELILNAAWGEVAVEITQDDVKAQGHICPGVAEVYTVGKSDELVADVDAAAAQDIQHWMDDTQQRRVVYRHAKRLGIVENAERNALAARLANEQIAFGQQVLVLVATKEQGREIAAQIPESKLVYSGMKVSEGRRSEIMDEVRAGTLRCMIATSLADQGLDLPTISVVVLASGGRGGREGYLIEQRAARAQRTAGGKTNGLIVDFFDDGHPQLRVQSFARLKKYKRMGFRLLRFDAQNQQEKTP